MLKNINTNIQNILVCLARGVYMLRKYLLKGCIKSNWWIGINWRSSPEWKLISSSLPAPSWPVSCSAPLPTVLFSDKRYFLNSHQFTFVDVIVSTIVNFSAFTKSLTLSIESVICLDDSHCVGATSSCIIHMSLLLISNYRFCCFPAPRI